ncbi:MAG: hypothetical protein Q9217_006653, partial [Psora testacea]
DEDEDEGDEDGAGADVQVALEELEEEAKGKKEDEPDISAFVEVFRKRGFVLREEPDLGNKMFVKMKFVKNFAKAGLGRGNGFGKTAGKRFVEEEGEELDEGSVLKPCVYKTR